MRQARSSSFCLETMHKEEIKFWIVLMKEHTSFIRMGLPAENQELRDEAKEFSRAFTILLGKVEKIKAQKQSEGFYIEICEVMEAFYQYKRKLLSMKLNGSLNGFFYPYYLDHLSQEAKYFLDWLRGLKAGAKHSQTREIVVWLRLMRDHTKLIAHYLDPSERRMQKMAEGFVTLFEDLTLEARDLAGMLYYHQGEVRAFKRFLQDARMDVQRLRDFNKMTQDLMEDGRLLSVMNQAMAAHMKREAEHCLMVIAMLEKGLIEHAEKLFSDETEEQNWILQERIEEESEATAVATPEEDILYYAGVNYDQEKSDIYEPYEYEESISQKEAVQEDLKLDLPDIKESISEAAVPTPAMPKEILNEAKKPLLRESAKQQTSNPPQAKEVSLAEAAAQLAPRSAAGKTPSQRIYDLAQNKTARKNVLPRTLGKK